MPPLPLTLLTARFTLRAPPVEMPATPGVALRGGLGKALRQVYCDPRTAAGYPLPHGYACPYCTIFAPPAASATDLHGLRDAPRPYMIRPPAIHPQSYHQDTSLRFDLVLIGWAAGYLPAIIAAFVQQGGVDLGQGRGLAAIHHIASTDLLSGETHGLFQQDVFLPGVLTPAGQSLWRALQTGGTLSTADPAGPPDAVWAVPQVRHTTGAEVVTVAESLPTALTLYFHTPLRLKQRGHWLRQPEPYALVVSALRRSGALCRAYGTEPWLLAADPPQRAAVLEATQAVQMRRWNTRWIEETRTSGATHQTMSLGGLSGYAVYTEVPLTVRAILLSGALVGVGDDVVFGNGAYTVLGGIL